MSYDEDMARAEHFCECCATKECRFSKEKKYAPQSPDESDVDAVTLHQERVLERRNAMNPEALEAWRRASAAIMMAKLPDENDPSSDEEQDGEHVGTRRSLTPVIPPRPTLSQKTVRIPYVDAQRDPDLDEYFSDFDLTREQRIKICTSYAAYLKAMAPPANKRIRTRK